MSLSTPFIHRPIATTLLTLALAMAGALAYRMLPVSPLPQVDAATISVSANLPGASPEVMASAVATPLERQFGRIAGVTEMTSSSSLGSTNITVQFDLNRDINAAARDIQAAINAARAQLPSNLPSNPSYKKVNPSDAPVMILALTSDIYDKARMYDVASSVLAQKLSQVDGVGEVRVGGGALPAVRVEVNPMVLNTLGLGLEDVRTVLGASNANRPKGFIAGPTRNYEINATDQLFKASEYQQQIVAYRNGAPVRLSAIATVVDSVEDVHTTGLTNGKPSVMLIIYRQPGANIIDTVDRVIELMPQLKAEVPAAIDITVALDRTTTIRASVRDVEMTLLLSIGLVILVVFLFLRDVRSTFIPSVAVPISLIGTFGVMYLCGYTLDNLSLMALTIATGFVVDDAIVVIENITRHLEQGMKPLDAALLGAKEIGFTVVSISVSLVAVFIPILLMGGLVGRLFREFAVTLSVAIGVSLIVSLTTTPMMCAKLLHHRGDDKRGRFYRASEWVFDWILKRYENSLAVVMRHRFVTLMVTLVTIAASVYFYLVIPRGFFPQQDTGRLTGQIKADQSTSATAMGHLVQSFADAVAEDDDVAGVIAFGGGGRGSTNSANMFVSLKATNHGKKIAADTVMARLRPKLGQIPGATLFLQSVQDLRTGGRASALQYQYTIQGDDIKELTDWAPKIVAKIRTLPGITQADSDQQNGGLQAYLDYDQATAQRLGISKQMIDDTLYDAFGQRQVSTMYAALNQYHVIMEVDPKFTQTTDSLRYVYVRSNSGALVPLSNFSKFSKSNTPLGINHSGQFPSITLSFNLAAGVPLGTAVTEIQDASREIGVPATIHGTFSGTAAAYQDSLSNMPILILAALLTVYLVLGILYESLIHPLTILSTLPSAGIGALVALMICGMELNVMSMIGILLLIGIVKKNAIMMIDFALEAERKEGKGPEEAIFQACLLRFRPIMMTTMAALLGALPLAIGGGTGSELRRPMGVAIVGGLIFSQMLTLYTTPVVYLYLDRLRLWFSGPDDHPVGELPADIDVAHA